MRSSSIVQKLVEKQARRESMRPPPSRPAPPEAIYWPVVTVSREPGSGGRTVAQGVATKLGFTYWDRDLLARVATESGAIESVLADVDERVHSSITEFLVSMLVGLNYTQGEYIRVLTRVMGRIARHGSAVVLGRGGSTLIPAARNLRVRLICPEAERIRRIASEEHVTEAEAAHRIAEATTRSVTFMRKHFHMDIRSPENYDLVVNTSAFSIDQIVDLVTQAYRDKFGRLPVVRNGQQAERMHEHAVAL